ncbi:MAG: fdrA domain protein [Candidatus Hodarchaeota archaeon]
MTNKIEEMLVNGPKVLNIGLESFYESMKTQGIPILHIDWEPPAQGDAELIALLEKLL